MPQAAPKPCTRCGVLVRDGTSRCAAHQVLPGSYADTRRGSRHKRGYGAAWDKLRECVLRRDHGVCQPCLRDGHIHPGTHVDHKVNKAEWKRRHGTLDGCDDESNLETICRERHLAKSAREGARGRAGQGGGENPATRPTWTGCAVDFLRAQDHGVGGVRK